jgi:hypothetical protein
VDGQAETTFEAADVVLEKVRVLVEVDGLERELSETLSSVGIGRGLRGDTAAAKFRSCAILWLSVAVLDFCDNGGTYLVIHLQQVSRLKCQSWVLSVVFPVYLT